MKRGGIGSAIGDCDANQDVVDIIFAVLHIDIKVAAVIENTGVGSSNSGSSRVRRRDSTTSCE